MKIYSNTTLYYYIEMHVFEEIEEILNKPGFKILIKETNITERQLVTYIIWNKYREYNQKIREKVMIIDKEISKGSFYRIIGQFRKNVTRAMLTIILLHLLNLVSTNDVLSIIEISDTIKSHDLLSDEKLLTELIKEVTNHIARIKK